MVHIKISDAGWILERLAREISSRLPYVTYDTSVSTDATIQYYMTYGCRSRRVSPIEVALFTHKELVPSAAEKFEKVASDVDMCIAQSLATADILKVQKNKNVTVISPGVDLERFYPELKIGVVGRTYHTGRKGEKLVASVMDIPGIEWHFTGQGWPGPAEFIPEEDMPAFYRSLDYVLVPALIEGGPMCVLEALASGCQVIASPVGWVPQFPHIGFKLGDANDLRRVLLKLVKKKADLRKSVENYTWDAWARQHHLLFTELLGYDPLKQVGKTTLFPQATAHDRTPLKSAVLVHGDEMSASLGGPSIRAPRTAAALRRIGVAADFLATRDYDASEYDISHVFNVWHPNSCDVLLRQIEKTGAASVFSPIFLDLTERPYFQGKLPQILAESVTAEQAISALAEQRTLLEERRSVPVRDIESMPGYFSQVRLMTSRADHLILLSEHERKLLASIGVNHPSTSVVKNPVDATMFANGDPMLFQEAYGVSDYVLCVGRIEARKNQALLALALRDTDIPLVLVGHEADSHYSELIRNWGNENVVFAGRLEPGSAMLASALAGSRVFCLPSWSEGAPLAALEAAAAGCNMVLSNRSSEEEYFGDLARYVDPADPLDIKEKILEAYSDSKTEDRKSRLAGLVRSENSWNAYAKDTADAYMRAKERHAARKLRTQQLRADSAEIFIDLTTLAHHKGPPTGIARVEDRLAHEMQKLPNLTVRYVLWNSSFRKFIEVSPDQIETGEIKDLRGPKALNLLTNPLDHSAYAEVDFPVGSRFVVFGGAWIRNKEYLNSLWALKCSKNISLISTLYDVIQYNHKSLFPAGTGEEFTENCSRLISISDMILTCSDNSRKDIIKMCLDKCIALPPIKLFRLGDEADSVGMHVDIQGEKLENLYENESFVIYVSSIDARKNHKLLFDLWRCLIEEFGDTVPTLVLVGRAMWKGDEIIEVLNSDSALRRKVKIYHGIDDVTLDWLYKNCLFTVYPSLYEGWGLPVAESLRHGKFCIASDAGSLPEVAPDCAEYIDPRDFMGWLKALKRYIFTPSALEQMTVRARAYKPTNWSEAAKQAYTAICGCLFSSQLNPLALANSINFCDSVNGNSSPTENYLLGGWGNAESGGRWTIGAVSTIGLRLDQKPVHDVAITMIGCGFADGERPVQVAVLVNGTALARWSIGPAMKQYYAVVPQHLIQNDAIVLVEFQILNPRSPASIGQSTDTRMLGIRAQSISLKELTTLVPFQWHDMDDFTASEIVFRRPEECTEAKFLSFAVETDRPGMVQAIIDGKVTFSFAVRRPGQEVLQAVEFSNILQDGQEVFSLSLTMEDPEAQAQLVRIGFLEKRPIEVLQQAVIPTRSSGSDNGHVPYIGNSPKLAIGSSLTPDGVLSGMAGGWHLLEPSGVWTNGRPASLYIRPEQTSGPSAISVHYLVFEPLRDSGASFWIKVGKQKCQSLPRGENGIAEQAEFCVSVEFGPEDLDEFGNLAISFFSSGAMAPSALFNSIDIRPLAIKFLAIALDNAHESDLALRHASASSANEDHSAGWYDVEPDGRWSDGTDSTIVVDLPQGEGAAIVELELVTFAGLVSGESPEVFVTVDGNETSFPVGGTPTICRVLVYRARTDRQVQMTLSCKSTARPSDMIGSVDRRILSFKLLGYAVSTADGKYVPETDTLVVLNAEAWRTEQKREPA